MKRIMSAIIMSIILIPILLLGGNIFAVAMAIIAVIALKELADLKVSHHPIPDFVFLISVLDVIMLTFSEFDGYSISFGLSYRAIALTFLSLLVPCLFYKNEKYEAKDAIFLSFSVLFIGLIFNSFILIRNYDLEHFIYLLLIAIITDCFALFVGKLIGKHKCAPTLSPKKTWEGCIGGTIMGTVIAMIYYKNIINQVGGIKLFFITMLFSVVGQLGDLFFSKIKRENKIKDYSNLIPGHGGVLDRIDSLIFITLMYIVFFYIV